MATVSQRALADAVGISHTALKRHIKRGVIEPDAAKGKFYRESIERVRRELAANLLNRWRHAKKLL